MHRAFLTLALVLSLAMGASAQPNARKYIFTGWDFGTVLLNELPLSADLFRDSASNGWRKGYAFVTVPEGADALSFQLSVHQPKGETAHYANVRIVKVK